MDEVIRELVRQRADHKCEYCLLKSTDDPLPFHIEHIIPRKHGGESQVENLALACQHCNLHKGPNLTGIDPETNEVTELFHPRRNGWNEHFKFVGSKIVGLTPIGRTTVVVLNMNEQTRVALRMVLGYGLSNA